MIPHFIEVAIFQYDNPIGSADGNTARVLPKKALAREI
jgi:hypothetical protein